MVMGWMVGGGCLWLWLAVRGRPAAMDGGDDASERESAWRNFGGKAGSEEIMAGRSRPSLLTSTPRDL